VNYGYDQYGSVSGITVNPVNANGTGVSTSTTTLLSGITYNADNLVSGWLWSDGKARTIGYDGNGLVSSYNLGDPLGTGATAGLLRSIQRDAAGRITGYTHTSGGSPAASFDQSFGYDNLDRLTTATQAATTTQYSYDETGNRTAKSVAGTSYANTISATSNRLNQVQDATGTATISHDAAGNIVGDGSFTYAYSDRGRMASVTTASGTVSYLYNGQGQRAKKSGPTAAVPTGASHFVYDEAGQLLGEYDANGNPVYETIYLGSTPVGALKQAGTAATSDIAVAVYNVSADHIDTPRLITKQDQTVVWRWDGAEAFGATAPDQNPTSQGTFAYNQRFPGQVFDAETGLFQNWNRDYDARLGRYRQSDPIGLAGGINTFSYVQNSPLLLTDPAGLQVMTPRGHSPLSPSFYGKLNPQAQGANADMTYQVGLSCNLGAAVMGISLEAGLATNSRLDDMCFYVQFCGVAGPQMVASGGPSYSAGDGLPTSGFSTAKGVTYFGGTGLVGAAQMTVSDSGQAQFARGGVRGQFGAGAGAGYVDCGQKMMCMKR